MAYQILKGWPSEGAIDMSIALDTDVVLPEGTGGAIEATGGKGILGNYDEDGTDAGLLPFFCIGVDNVTGKVLGLMSNCMIEVDSDHYEAGSYAPGVAVTLKGGKFDIINVVVGATTGASDYRPVVGRVLSYDAASGKLVIAWGIGTGEIGTRYELATSG
jgi:hypothetical protein